MGCASRYKNMIRLTYKIAAFLALWSRRNNNYILICLIPKLNTPFVIVNISNLNPVKAICSRHTHKNISNYRQITY